MFAATGSPLKRSGMYTWNMKSYLAQGSGAVMTVNTTSYLKAVSSEIIRLQKALNLKSDAVNVIGTYEELRPESSEFTLLYIFFDEYTLLFSRARPKASAVVISSF